MTEPEPDVRPLPYVAMTNQQLLQVIITGLAVGLVVWGLSFVLEMYVLKALVCGGDDVRQCTSLPAYASATASIVAAGVGLFVLVKQQIFRPLLVVLASVIALWGLPVIVNTMPPYAVAAACILLYAAAYVAFAWVSRLRFFLPAVIVVVVVVVAIRLILTA